MKIEITATPKYHFSLEEADITLLSHVARFHYDAVCRSLASEVENPHDPVAGRLTRWARQLKVQQEWAKDEGIPIPTGVQVNAEFRDLDTLLKAMEMAHHFLRDEDLSRINRLRAAFFGALNYARERLEGNTLCYDHGPAVAPAAA